METGSDRPIGVSPFHSRGSLKGFLISGRWPDSTKEWAQLLMVAVRIASLPGLLSTTTVFGAREELPDEPEPDTVGLVLAEGTVFGESAIQPGYFADHQPPRYSCCIRRRKPRRRCPNARGGIGMRIAARVALSRPGTPGGLGGGRSRRHHHVDGEPGRRRSDQPSRHGDFGDAARRLARTRRREWRFAFPAARRRFAPAGITRPDRSGDRHVGRRSAVDRSWMSATPTAPTKLTAPRPSVSTMRPAGCGAPSMARFRARQQMAYRIGPACRSVAVQSPSTARALATAPTRRPARHFGTGVRFCG